ncbi:hypothetical protein AVEN_23631-1 [Araneus ventricosus]|uniref:Uncharacterized protein n=1 Tax=Araneus ventricosus TaxID=182803 RepID=A0A4Y2BJ04_ARAVE|nr:hypothetical protein AVEN_23631-1 [Araneus ventricosus]
MFDPHLQKPVPMRRILGTWTVIKVPIHPQGTGCRLFDRRNTKHLSEGNHWQSISMRRKEGKKTSEEKLFCSRFVASSYFVSLEILKIKMSSYLSKCYPLL